MRSGQNCAGSIKKLKIASMADAKPFRGKIRNWYRWIPERGCDEDSGWRPWAPNAGYIICSLFDGHEDFNGYTGHTSPVISEKKTPGEDVIEIETMSSKYLLVGEPIADGVIAYGSDRVKELAANQYRYDG